MQYICWKCRLVGTCSVWKRYIYRSKEDRNHTTLALATDCHWAQILYIYYRKFVPNFAYLAKPLHARTEQNKKFIWSEECQESFNILRARLVKAPLLAHPDFSKAFILDTDASDTAIGAVLSQTHDGEERVISYASRCLTIAKRKYCVTRKE